ncbi:MAG TPA: acyl-ACP--UDP-N-acetylglucosamine O-acyltransferase [bacterium]|nr:acyl-ACP--UDP-N-acetylglucosamine O-acyltransferase [bacterium]
MTQPTKDSSAIHPTAVVDPNARLGKGVSIGPYCVIEADVQIGDGTEVMNHVTIHGPTVIGQRNRIYPYAFLGQDPQDKKFKRGEASSLEIGDDNVIREYATINRGTQGGGGVTRVGARNLIMAYCHIAHDCQVGDDTVFANCATLGGHVHIGNKAYLGGFTAVHQFCSVGEMTMTGGQTMIAQDVPPYVIAAGNRARLFGVNRIGLERNGLPPEEIEAVQRAYKLYFRGKMSSEEALAAIEARFSASEHVKHFVDFIRHSKRGICR